MINVEAYCIVRNRRQPHYKYNIFSLDRLYNGNLCWKEEGFSDNPPEGAMYLPDLKDRSYFKAVRSFFYKQFKESDLLSEAKPLN